MKTLKPKGIRVSFANNVPQFEEDKGGPTDVVKKRTGANPPRSPSPTNMYLFLHRCYSLGASNLVRSREDAEARIRIRTPEVTPELHIRGQPMYEEKEKGKLMRPSSAFSASNARRGSSSSRRPSSAPTGLRRPFSAPSLKVREKMTAQGQDQQQQKPQQLGAVPNNNSCNCSDNLLQRAQRPPLTRRPSSTQPSMRAAWEHNRELCVDDVMPCYAQMLHKGRSFRCSSSVQTKMQPGIAGFPGKPRTPNREGKNRLTPNPITSFYPPLLLELQRGPNVDRKGKKSMNNHTKRCKYTSDAQNDHQRTQGGSMSSTNLRFTRLKNGVPRRGVPQIRKDALYDSRRDDEYKYAEYVSMRLSGARKIIRNKKEGEGNGRYNSPLMIEGNIRGGKVCCFDERPATTPFGIGCKGRSSNKCNYKVGYIVIPQGPCSEVESVAPLVSPGGEKIETKQVQEQEWKC